MKKLLSWSVALALLLSFTHSAFAKKQRKPFEERAGDAGASMGTYFPITEEGNGFIMGISGGYQLLDHLDATLSLGMAADEDSHVVMSNPVISVGSSLWPTKMKRGWGASLNGRLNLGLGLFGIDREQRRASALGTVGNQSWLSFLSEHLVVGPQIGGALRLGSIFMGGSVAPQIAIPVHHTDGRDTELAIRYSFSLGTGFGDHRGGLSFGIGMTGLSEVTTEAEENRFSLELGVGVRFRVIKKQGLRISAGLSIPLGGEDLGTSVIVGGNIGWGYAVEIEEEEDQAVKNGAKGWSAPYGIWPR